MSRKSIGIYIHIPFCRRKCIYCDFYTVGARLANWPELVSAILNEFDSRLDELGDHRRISIYFGGGTPSLLPLHQFRLLINGIRQRIQQRQKGDIEWIETTLEVNPEDVTPEQADAWKNSGVDRISMGVQTLNDSELKLIGRRHSASQAIQAYQILSERFSNISLDLIFGLPGESEQSVSQTVDQFIELRPQHISAYSLMYEERTALTRMRDHDMIEETPEVSTIEMFSLITEKLRRAGYRRYEISNYALPGFESRHNSSYWHSHPYIGLGPAAHSYDGRRTRRANIPDFRAYLAAFAPSSSSSPSPQHGAEALRAEESSEELSAGLRLPPFEIETLSDEELREERIMTELRCEEGIDLAAFRQSFGQKKLNELLREARRYLKAGTMVQTETHLALTDSGIMVSDLIIASLF